MPIAPATVFPTAAPTLPGAGTPVVSAGFGQALDGVIGAKPAVLPPAFAAPRPEDTAALLATAQAAPVVPGMPAQAAPAATAVIGESIAGSDGVPVPTVPAPANPVPVALAPSEPAATLPASAPAPEPEGPRPQPHLAAPDDAATTPGKEAETPAPQIAEPAVAAAVLPQPGPRVVAQVAAPAQGVADAPADDGGANDNPAPEERASVAAPAAMLPAAIPAPAVPLAVAASAAPKDGAKPEARALAAPSDPASPGATEPFPGLAARTGEPSPADPQDGFADRLAAQVPAIAGRSGSDAAPAPAASQPGAIVQQAPAPVAPAAAAPSAPTSPAAAIPTHQPNVTAQPGRIGREMGVAIARRVVEGRQELTVRLNPAELGRIEVKMGFSEHGTLRATVAAESAVALDLLRRDSADLGRALADAGVRADAQSFRFDTRSGESGGGGAWQRQGGQGGQNGNPGQQSYPGGRGYAAEHSDSEPVYRALRTSGRVDLMA